MSSEPATPAPAVRVVVVTVSDGCAAGVRDDLSGEVMATRLVTLPAQVVARLCVPDDVAEVAATLTGWAARADIVALTGGTGIGPRDVTPQAITPLLDYEVPGMAEAMRARGREATAHAMLSRQVVGVRGRCLVLALPGSPRAVAECLDAVWPALPHALALLRGGAADHGPPA